MNILGKRIIAAFASIPQEIYGVEVQEVFVEIENFGLLQLDDTGIEACESFSPSKIPKSALTELNLFPYSQSVVTIKGIFICDRFASFCLLLSNDKFLTVGDLGPPFRAVGPIYLGIKDVQSKCVDYFTRHKI